MLLNFPGNEEVSFGKVKPEIDALLQQGVVAYRTDFSRARKRCSGRRSPPNPRNSPAISASTRSTPTTAISTSPWTWRKPA